jgi:hypothetical protein
MHWSLVRDGLSSQALPCLCSLMPCAVVFCPVHKCMSTGWLRAAWSIGPCNMPCKFRSGLDGPVSPNPTILHKLSPSTNHSNAASKNQDVSKLYNICIALVEQNHHQCHKLGAAPHRMLQRSLCQFWETSRAPFLHLHAKHHDHHLQALRSSPLRSCQENAHTGLPLRLATRPAYNPCWYKPTHKWL